MANITVGEALETLLTSRWFFDRCESANYHSLYGRHGFLAELKEEYEENPDFVARYSTMTEADICDYYDLKYGR